MKDLISKIKNFKYQRAANLTNAYLWKYIYWGRNLFYLFRIKHGVKITTVSILFLLICICLILQSFHEPIEFYFSNQKHFSDLKSLYIALGGALIGSSVIAFTLVMFAMQVNVERMPYGLFHKFASDFKLLGAFFTTFLLAILVISLSLIPKAIWSFYSLNFAICSTILIIILFIYAYRRALSLISPTQQLIYVFQDVKDSFSVWNKAIKRTIPFFENPMSENNNLDERVNHDVSRIVYFKRFPMWTDTAKKAIFYCNAYSRGYAVKGDHEISRQALEMMIAINHEYIKIKGKTFFTSNYLLDNPLTHDHFITGTLEDLRQTVQIGISRGDEQLIQNTLRAMLQLSQICLVIDYGDQYAKKYHAHLAAMYLCAAVETVVRHNKVDVLMEGIRLMGRAALAILRNDDPIQTLSITEKISVISSAAVTNQNFQPVTITGVKELAKLQFEILYSKYSDIDHPIKEVRKDLSLIANMCLKYPNVLDMHVTCLRSYYSISTDTFLEWLTKLSNELINADENNKDAKRVIRNITQWSDDLYENEKQLLLVAIEKKSPLTFHLIYWIIHVTKLLLALSTAKACSSHSSEDLKKNARWLIYVMTWIPDNEEAITFVENYQLTEKLFEAAEDAFQRNCIDIAENIRDILFSWGFKAGKYQNGWSSLERTMYGLATLDILMGNDGDKLLQKIEQALVKEDAPSQEIRKRTTEGILRHLKQIPRDPYTFSQIERTMSQLDQNKLGQLLEALSGKLSPV